MKAPETGVGHVVTRCSPPQACRPQATQRGRRSRHAVLPAVVALGTAIAGLGIQSALHLWLAWRRSPLVQQQRGTLTFISALVGDGLILPVVNATVAVQLRRWDQPLQPRLLLRALGMSAAMTAVVHAGQGLLRLVNWSMPRPFVWNWIGWYHAIFMWGQIAYLVYGAQAAVRRWRAGYRDPLGLAGVVTGGMAVFAALLAYDYRRNVR